MRNNRCGEDLPRETQAITFCVGPWRFPGSTHPLPLRCTRHHCAGPQLRSASRDAQPLRSPIRMPRLRATQLRSACHPASREHAGPMRANQSVAYISGLQAFSFDPRSACLASPSTDPLATHPVLRTQLRSACHPASVFPSSRFGEKYSVLLHGSWVSIKDAPEGAYEVTTHSWSWCHHRTPTKPPPHFYPSSSQASCIHKIHLLTTKGKATLPPARQTPPRLSFQSPRPLGPWHSEASCTR